MISLRPLGFSLTVAVSAFAMAPSVGGAQQQLTTPDGSVSVVLPDGFVEIQMNAVADLQYSDTIAGSFFMLLTEAKDDLFGWNLTRHSRITLAQMLTVTDFPELVGPTSLTVGGYPAVQFEMRGVSQGTQITFLHTTVDTPTQFAQVLVWSLRSKWTPNEPILRGVLESIQFSDTDVSSSVPLTDIFAIVQGTWAWESRETPCSSDTQTFTISDDRTRMTIAHSEPYEGSDGAMTSTTDYVIEGASPLVLHTFIVDESRLTDEGVPVKWDLVVLGSDRIAWHRTDWAEGGLTEAMALCERPGG